MEEDIPADLMLVIEQKVTDWINARYALIELDWPGGAHLAKDWQTETLCGLSIGRKFNAHWSVDRCRQCKRAATEQALEDLGDPVDLAQGIMEEQMAEQHKAREEAKERQARIAKGMKRLNPAEEQATPEVPKPTVRDLAPQTRNLRKRREARDRAVLLRAAATGDLTEAEERFMHV